MSVVGKVGKKRLRARFSMGMVYGLLTLGAITTLYPFAVMLCTGFKGASDQHTLSLVPAFWKDDAVLFKKYVEDKYAGDLSLIESIHDSSTANQEQVKAYQSFLTELPIEYWKAGFRASPGAITGRLDRRYQNWLRNRYKSIENLNQAYIEENIGFQTVSPPIEMLERKNWVPASGEKYTDWLLFKKELPVEYRIPVLKRTIFQEFLRAKYKNQIEHVPEEIAQGANVFEKISLPSLGECLNECEEEWMPERYKVASVENLWAKKYTGSMPIPAYEKAHVARYRAEIKKEFTFRNYLYVLDYILLHGKALKNTAIFCLLAVLLQLIINPLAAYALSRHNIPATGKILIFLLATMAFPAEVTLIPSFLLLKDLGLLNTFAALVLPTAVSGYMIFLLKGFFDSLPRELYESGEMDGAKETMLLSRIALPLSKPVLGYMGLLAFMGAYSAFMYAFLVAQDQKMWTLMVWIYQFQLHAPKSTMMAALVIATIPSILVFMLAQRAIAQGVVLPEEK